MNRPARQHPYRSLLFFVSLLLLAAPALGAETESWVCDLEQDGCLERVCARWDRQALVLRLDSGAILAELGGLSAGERPRLADIDGDGWLELFAGDRRLWDVRDWIGPQTRGLSGFEEKWNSGGALNNVWDSEVDDLDGDGAAEILGQAYYYPGTLVRVFENDANDHFTEVWASTEQNTPSIVALGTGETDGDGQREIMAGVAGTLGTLYMWENTGDDLYEPRPLGVQMDWQVRDLHVGDTDEDGSRELVGVGSTTDGGKLKIFEHSGAVGQNVYTNVYTYETVSYLLGCEIGDADNDGKLEMLLNVGGWVGFPTYIRRVEYNPDLGTWEHKLFEASTTGLPISAEIGDFDLDGDNELAVGSAEVIHIYESYSDDTFTPVWSSSFVIPGNLMDLTLGPLSEHGYPMLASCSFDGHVDFFGYDGAGYVRLMDTPLSVGEPLRSVDVGLFDGADLLLDLVLARSGSALISLFEELDLTAVDWLNGEGTGLFLELSSNPFRSNTEIRFSAPPGSSPLELSVYDTRGRLVRELARSAVPDREHVLSWDGRDARGNLLSNGVYLLRLRTGNAGASARAVLLR